MRGKLVALIIGVAVGGASTAGAATIIDRTIRSHGVICGFGVGETGEGVGCGLVKEKRGRSYRVSLTNRQVIVWRDAKKVYVRRQP